MNKTILTLAISSLSSPLFTPVTRTTMFSLSFSKLRLSHFFNSFIQSTSSSCNIKIHHSDFGFFLSTVINIEAATHDVNNRDMTEPYTDGSGTAHLGWITCPSIDCFDSLFHDIVATGYAAGAICCQWQTVGAIRRSTFTRIKTTTVAEAAAVAARSGGKADGQSIIDSCCFSNCIEEHSNKYNSFNLESPVKIEVSLTLIIQCGNEIGSNVCALKSTGSKVKVTSLNSSLNNQLEGGSGISFLVSSTCPGAKLKQSTFLKNKGIVVIADSEKGEYSFPLDIIQCNFISNECKGSIGGKLSIIEVDGKRYKLNLVNDVFSKNINEEILTFYGYGKAEYLIMDGCLGDSPFLSDILNYPLTDAKYKVVSSPLLNNNPYMNTQACFIQGPHDPNDPADPPKSEKPNDINDPAPQKNALSGGKIAGIVIGSIAGVAVISVAAFFGIKKFLAPKVSASDPQFAN